MSRVKRGTMHVKRRRNLRAAAKGYRWGRKKLQKLAKVAVTKAGVYAHRDRRNKKRAFRRLWQVRLNAALRMRGTNYSTFMNRLKKAGIILDRKSLANLATNYPAVFDKIVEKIR